MKKVILLALFMPVLAYSQVIENFESGNINNWVQSPEGRWKADSTTAISGRFSLHHVFDNSDTGTDRIGIPVKNLHPSRDLTRWTFLVRHGYDPSSSNYWSVFLMSDSEPSKMGPDGSANGFVIGVNLTGYDDSLRLFKVKGKVLTTVVNCRINWQTQIGITDPVKISVERSKEGNWTVSVCRINGNIVGSASGADSELFTSSWFGIYYKYSSTRDRLLWFDELRIEGDFYVDMEPPVINRCLVSGNNSVEITLNEEPAIDFPEADNFSLNEEENKPASVIKKNDLSYRIEFADRLINKHLNNLIINNLCDKSGNCSQNVQISFTPVWAEPSDVLISEIMANPLPVVSLPGKEYLELTNRTEYSFNLKNWTLTSEGQVILFPGVIIEPSEIRIICFAKDTSLFKKYGKVTGLKQFPSLTQEGKIICLSDSSGNLIHGVDYSVEWYGEELKSGGGWSLEMIDTGFPFYDEGNWNASTSRSGGTPGTVNSVSHRNPDIGFLGIQNVFPDDSISIRIRFSEPVINLPDDMRNIKIEEKEILDFVAVDPLFREFQVRLKDPLITGEAYQLEISESIKDYAGNSIQKQNFVFGLPEPSGPGDLLFNELLFNPLPGDPDYIELFNNSEKVIDASRLQLVSVNDGTGDLSQSYPLSTENRCIMPGSYYAITTDTGKIFDRYFSTDPAHLFEVASIPSMPDDKGHLKLYSRELDRIDEVFFNENLHSSLLQDNEGISLAKIHPSDASEEAINWSSASESSGWGTPGAPNFLEDNDPPVIKVCKVAGKNSVEITLNEEPATDFPLADNFSLNDSENILISVIKESALIYRMEFADTFINRKLNNLIINKLCDKSDNCSQNVQISFTPVWAEPGDVIISEIMANPLPAVSLPGKEYIELTNRTEYSINLKNWKLSSEGQNVLFPGDTIKAFEIRILCLSQDTSLFRKYGNVTGLERFSMLTERGKTIFLTDSSGTMIHGVEYSSDWYGDELKSGGGWSLEMIDVRYPFFDEGNWEASSSDLGGTPGSLNSLSGNNPDVLFDGVQNVFPTDSMSIIVRFSEPVLNHEADIKKVRIVGDEIINIIPTDPLFREFLIKPENPIIKRKVYQLDISDDIKDFAGNKIQKLGSVFGLPEASASGDILFNELLFNPLPGDPDYIELFNSSEKVIDASRLLLVSVNDGAGDTSQVCSVSYEKRCIMPGTYYAITTNKTRISDRYFSSDPEYLFGSVSLPSMSDDKGHLILFNMELEKIDEVFYSEKMHFSLLSGFEGVALEKTGPRQKSGESFNWHSASESSGWGTPGAPNSVYIELPVTSDRVFLSSSKITPDNDGIEDFLKIDLSLKGNGNIVSVLVFDEMGNYIKKIGVNMLAGPETSLIWDGTADDGTTVNTGIYIVFITLYDDTGKTEKWKKVCTVVRN